MRAMGPRTQTDTQAFHEALADLDNLVAKSLGGAEGLDRASCAPNLTYLAQIGIGAAARGCSRDGWRTEVSKIDGPEATAELDEAEQCMRQSGLWPWR